MDQATLATNQRGLSTSDVEQRRARGEVNTVTKVSSRTRLDIVKANLFTRFNALIVILAIVVIVVGEWIDLTFALVMAANAAIGIFQELRAKKTLDDLSVLVASTVEVVRDGVNQAVAVGDVVLGDRVLLKFGDQVPVDATVTDADGCEVDESALTGEADPVVKQVGDEVRSGSAVVAGRAGVVATRVGDDVWIHQLEQQAKAFDPVRSELRVAIDQILRYIGWMVGPLAALLVWSQLRSGSTVAHGLVAAVAGIVALVPQGLVLLVSVTMATAVVRLARQQVVVKELGAVEGLARVDVICVDKTGTLTTGRLALEAIEPIGDVGVDLHEGLAALAVNETSPTSMFALISAEVGAPPHWEAIRSAAFSSARKWSGTSFTGHGTWIIGAPEIILDAIAPERRSAAALRLKQLASSARRVLLVAWTSTELGDEQHLPVGLESVGIVIMNEELRSDAAQTMRYFLDQGVDVKVISGDSAQTVAAVARELGIPGADKFIDLRSVDQPLANIVEAYTVFGRVLPEQKRELVIALQQAGHTVAMTGDGVNDIPAVKAADIGIAMDTATPATKAVADVVLLNGRFDLLPGVVAEGRRVIANMERVSSLFVTKTVYATVFALVAGLSQQAYPFLPRHLSLIADLTVGVPAFLLGFRPTSQRLRPGYLHRVVQFSLPTGCGTAAVTMCVFWLLRSGVVGASLQEARTGATMALAACGFWVLYRLIRPLDQGEVALVAVLMLAFAAVFAIAPIARLYSLHLPGSNGLILMATVVAGGLSVLQFGLNRITRDER